ncbi:MAG: SRPBCC domain-containing protein [Rhizobiaceae bacterium]
MTDTILRKSIYLNASKEQVWEYLTDPDKLAIWFHKPKAPLKGGEDYAMYGAESGDKLMWGEVLKSNPFDELEYTFTIAPMGGATSTVNWKLEDVAGGTRLSLEHTGLPQGAEAFGLTLALDKGWDDHIGRMRESLSASIKTDC